MKGRKRRRKKRGKKRRGERRGDWASDAAVKERKSADGVDGEALSKVVEEKQMEIENLKSPSMRYLESAMSSRR